MQLAIVGAGYVGLVTAACFAHLGNEVRVLEVDPARVADLRRGVLPIREPGLNELVVEGLSSGRLSFDTDPATLHGARLVVVAVGTLDRDSEWTDAIVRAAVEQVARDADAPRAIVIRSTLLPGSARAIGAAARVIDPRVEVAHNPEFTREATAVSDFLTPDRVVIGVDDPDSPLVDDLRRLYAPLEAPVVVTDVTSAETIKLASNVFLAAKITFANELARLCAATGADVGAVVDGMGLDARIGRAFLSPGPGFGGSCFPSQSRALPELAARAGVQTQLMEQIWASNAEQADWLLDRLEVVSGRSLKDARVALLGLTFKAGTDDLRESPALRLAARLGARGASIAAYDPIATIAGVAELAAQGVAADACATPEEACAGADVVVVATEWPEFRQLDWRRITPTMRGSVLADERHAVDVEGAAGAGLLVIVLGVVVAGQPAARGAEVAG